MHGAIRIHAPGIELKEGDRNKWLLSPFIFSSASGSITKGLRMHGAIRIHAPGIER